MNGSGSSLATVARAERWLAWSGSRHTWSLWSYAYILPAFVFLGVFSYYPIAWMAHCSLHQYDGAVGHGRQCDPRGGAGGGAEAGGRGPGEVQVDGGERAAA